MENKLTQSHVNSAHICNLNKTRHKHHIVVTSTQFPAAMQKLKLNIYRGCKTMTRERKAVSKCTEKRNKLLLFNVVMTETLFVIHIILPGGEVLRFEILLLRSVCEHRKLILQFTKYYIPFFFFVLFNINIYCIFFLFKPQRSNI